MPSPIRPRNVATAPGQLAVAWGDGHESFYPVDDLRRACPCAACRTARTAPRDPLRVVRAPEPGRVAIARLEPVGAYALRVVWSDGHAQGLWTWEALRAACPCAACRGRDAIGPRSD